MKASNFLKITWAFFFTFTILSLTSFASNSSSSKSGKADDVSVKGEVVDLACYLGHGAKGEGHKSCAQNCINGGQPMGLLTEDGTVYLLLGNHDDMKPFDELKKHAAATVTVTGTVNKSSGMNSLEVDKVAY